jgi:hypothetical protein
MATHTGITTGEFEKIVKDWIATAKHPKTGKVYTDTAHCRRRSHTMRIAAPS